MRKHLERELVLFLKYSHGNFNNSPNIGYQGTIVSPNKQDQIRDVLTSFENMKLDAKDPMYVVPTPLRERGDSRFQNIKVSPEEGGATN